MGVSRRLASPTRPTSNRGERPRFIGEIPSPKAPSGKLPFDSMATLVCFIYLEWCLWTKWIEFEPEWFDFPVTGDLPAIRCLPDFRATQESGEFKIIEAKSRRERLSPEKLGKLENIRGQFAVRGVAYEVIYRSDLEANGFIDTIGLLRRFGHMSFPKPAIEYAHRKLSSGDAADLEAWVARARQKGVPVGLLHHLLYHQRLPLIYRKILHPEIRHWRA